MVVLDPIVQLIVYSGGRSILIFYSSKSSNTTVYETLLQVNAFI